MVLICNTIGEKGWLAMHVVPANPVLQALSGAQETGVQRQQASVSSAGQTVTARAVGALDKSEGSKTSQLKTRRDAESPRGNRSKSRGNQIDIFV